MSIWYDNNLYSFSRIKENAKATTHGNLWRQTKEMKTMTNGIFETRDSDDIWQTDSKITAIYHASKLCKYAMHSYCT